MNIRCPECRTLYRVDPERVPEAGIRARCSQCRSSFLVRRVVPAEAARGSATPDPVRSASPVPGAAAASAHEGPSGAAGPTMGGDSMQPGPALPSSAEASSPAVPAAASAQATFARPDPADRAQRLARALVSDIVAYNAERVEQSFAAGTLREDLRDEILKSWEEYVLQVGQQTADDTPYFRDALNEILARGQAIF